MTRSSFFKFIPLYLFLILPAFPITAEPSMKFDQTEKVFNEVTAGKIVEVKFAFQNTGNSALNIIHIVDACNCTKSSINKILFNPGEKGEITVRFFTKGLKDKVYKIIKVRTDDPASPETRLAIKGTVLEAQIERDNFLIENPAIDFGEVEKGRTCSKKIIIRNVSDADYKILEVQTAPEILFIIKKKKINKKNKMEAEIIFNPMEKGYHSSFVKVFTDDYKNPSFAIKINAKVK